MPEKREKAIKYLTPAGEAAWPWVNKFDDRDIKGKPQKPAYKLPIQYDAKNPAWLALKEKIDALVDEAYEKACAENAKKKKVIQRAYPYTMLTDDDGEETGKVELRTKQNAFFKDKKSGKIKMVTISLFDAAGTPLKNALRPIYDENTEKVTGFSGSVVVYGGSVVKASFTTRPYFMESSDKAGVSLDLKAVQVLQLVSSSGGQSASSYGFTPEEGYTTGEDEVETVTESTNTSADETDATDF